EHLLSTKVASLLPLGGSWIVLLLVTGLVGGLVSGLAALTASFLRGKPEFAAIFAYEFARIVWALLAAALSTDSK
ncbi:hypothetical protein ABTH88_22720, partial [Acinetobacter baumannii]